MNRFLVARASASDDATTAENATAVSQTVTAPNVDYTIVSVTPAAPSAVTAGALVNESFDIDNTGTADGTQLIFWNAYVSDNTTIDINDTLVGSGSTAAMTAAEAPKNIPVTTGNWPASGGPYYLLVGITADDDTDPSIASNTDFSSAMTINPIDVDYTVSTVTYTGGTLVPAATVNGEFQFQNAGTDDGVQNVNWAAYASTDMTLDPTDAYVDSGSGVAPLATLATSAAIPFSGTWPLDYGNYYLLVKVSASDDVNVANDTGTTVGTQAVGIYSDSEPNGDYTNLVEYQDLGTTLQPGMSLRVAGQFTDTADLDDIFGFDTGTATAVTFSVTWSSGGADLRFLTMSGPNTFITGVSGTTDWLSMYWTVDAPGVMRWLDLENMSLPAAPPGNWPYQYTLIITAD